MRVFVVLLLLIVCIGDGFVIATENKWTITQIVPRCAKLAVQTRIAINGRGFDQEAGTKVFITSQSSQSGIEEGYPLVEFQDSTRIIATIIPFELGEMSVTVQQYGKNITLGDTLFVYQSDPILYAIQPNTGWGGQQVTIIGEHFLQCSPLLRIGSEFENALGACDYVFDEKIICTIPTYNRELFSGKQELSVSVALDAQHYIGSDGVTFTYIQQKSIYSTPDWVWITIGSLLALTVVLGICFGFRDSLRRCKERRYQSKQEDKDTLLKDYRSPQKL